LALAPSATTARIADTPPAPIMAATDTLLGLHGRGLVQFSLTEVFEQAFLTWFASLPIDPPPKAGMAWNDGGTLAVTK
jgi:hypothetical protein